MSTEAPEKITLPPLRFSRKRKWAADQAIGFLMEQSVGNSDVISLAAGLVDQESLPVEETRNALNELLSDDRFARQMLQYGTTAGYEKLRDQLLVHLANLEGCSVEQLQIDRDQIIVTTGSQQFLSLVGEVLLDPGDICLVAAPTYFVFLSLLDGLGAKAIAIETDADGMRTDALEAQLQRLETDGQLERVKLIYAVSYYENPSGISLSEERRPELVEIARRWSKRNRILVLEDAAYRELQYDGPQHPSVWGFDDEHESVILTQTFSKSYSPGLRVGFGVVPRELVDPIFDRKSNEDFGSANFNQHLISSVMDSGLYESHVEIVRNSYRKKRDRMLRAADQYFSHLDGVNWVHPHGGLYVWMSLPETIETGFSSRLFQVATHEERVMYVPGELFYADDFFRQRNQLRLSFGVQTLEGIDEGMKRLANAVASIL